jgi:hypothetical protein
MADIELVIKIHEKDYQTIKNGHIPFSIFNAIMNGTPLPEHHTDLIERRCGNEVCNGCEHFDICDIYNAPTIIEGSDE